MIIGASYILCSHETRTDGMVAACKRTDYEIGKTSVILPFSQVNTSECRVMNMDSLFNANVTDISGMSI